MNKKNLKGLRDFMVKNVYDPPKNYVYEDRGEAYSTQTTGLYFDIEVVTNEILEPRTLPTKPPAPCYVPLGTACNIVGACCFYQNRVGSFTLARLKMEDDYGIRPNDYESALIRRATNFLQIEDEDALDLLFFPNLYMTGINNKTVHLGHAIRVLGNLAGKRGDIIDIDVREAWEESIEFLSSD